MADECVGQVSQMDLRELIALWRDRAKEARAHAAQMQEGSVSHIMMLNIAETYERLARWEEKHLPRAFAI